MERTTRGFTTTPPQRSRPDQASGRPDRLDRSNPASRQVNRSLRAAEYDQFARSIRRDLNPQGPLEDLVARQAVRSAWRLKANLDGVEAIDEVVGSPEAERAARSLEVAITTLDLLQGRRIDVPLGAEDLGLGSFGPENDAALLVESNEWPIVPDEGADDQAIDFDLDLDLDEADDAPIWRDRLIYDFDVSDHSPVVKGTWITVSHVVSLIVDGASWADILRSHPELAEEDIRMCVAYAVAEDDSVI